MFFTISLDSKTLIDQFAISKDDIESFINYVVKDVTVSYVRKLEQEAKRSLHGTRERYVKSIRVYDEGRMKGAVILDFQTYPIVRMVEDGASPFDMKEGFENSLKRHIKKNGMGWYLSIPFRQANPNAIAESDVFANIMPKEVYSIISQKNTEISTATGLKSSSLKQTELPEKFALPQTRKKIVDQTSNRTFEAYTHKSSIYVGISKIKDIVTGQNTYMSFRRVSDNSDPNSWIHPGIQARKLMDKALFEFEQELPYQLNVSTNNALKVIGL